MAREAEIGVNPLERRVVAPRPRESLGVEVHVAIVLERDELTAQKRLLAMRLQVVAQALALNLREVVVNALERAVGVQELARGFGADVRHTGNVVRAVPHEREQVRHLRHLDAEALHDLGRADHPIAHGVPHEHVVTDELHEILVGGDDDRSERLLAAMPNGRGDEVIGFDPVLLEASHRERSHDVLAALELGGEVGRRRRAMRFVLRVDIAPKRIAPRIHRYGEEHRFAFAHEPLEHRDGAVNGLRRLA